jgi:hypothetical protein
MRDCSSLYSSSCHNSHAWLDPFVHTSIGRSLLLRTCRYTRFQAMRTNDRTILHQPTGMAFTPVPHSLPFGRPFFPVLECFRPPRCVVPSSSSPTVHVRLPAAFCSMPDVVENRWGRSGSTETCLSPSPAVTCFSWRFFYQFDQRLDSQYNGRQ